MLPVLERFHRDGLGLEAQLRHRHTLEVVHTAELGVAHLFEAVDTAIDYEKDRKNGAPARVETRREYADEFPG
jgi:hypothetical protein